MLNLKTQFEIRYSNILNFREEYKAVISPYLKFSNFNIHNPDTLGEYIVLTFNNDKYFFDCRWDKMVFVSEGVRDDLKKPQGPLFYFFQIFDKLKQLPTFGNVKNTLLAEWNLNEVNYGAEVLKEKFRSTFLSNKSFKTSIDNKPGHEDFSFTCTYGDQEEKYQKFTIGPFFPQRDIKTYDLLPVTKKSNSELEEKRGVFSESVVFEKADEANFDTFKKANRVIGDYLKQIKLDE